MALQSRKENVKEKMNEIPCIDVNVKIAIPRSPDVFDETKHKFKCLCCGKGFTSKNGKFNKSKDVLFQSNDGYLPWCKECVEKYVIQMTALFTNNEELAIKDFCQRAGWNYDLNPLVASRETYSGHRDRHRLFHYAAKKNLNCGGRKTFIDSLKFAYLNKQDEIIQSKEEIKIKEVSVTGTAIDRWGGGLNEWDYTTLEEHYKMLKKNNPNCDNNQEIFVKALCNLNWLMMKTLRSGDGDSDKYVKLTEQYSKTFTKAGLKTVQETDNSGEETLGVTLATISQYTPEEYYKDKELYKDFDKLGEYFDRFVKRPLKNLMTGSKDRDYEYSVKEDNLNNDIEGDLDG